MNLKKKIGASGAQSVMASRTLPTNSLDFFPTPPWATRALTCEILDERVLRSKTCWEPAAGAGHMSDVLRETFAHVVESDVHDYDIGARIGSFVGDGLDVVETPVAIDWIITNPPFNLAEQFVVRALRDADCGVAMLVRLQWLESETRYSSIFRDFQPAMIALFADRVSMVHKRWDPAARGATSYAWVIWFTRDLKASTRFRWIAPGAELRHSRPDDIRRFAGR